MTGADRLIVRVRFAVPVPPALVALNETVEVPATVGVPVIAPVLVFTLNPTGKPVALKLVGLLLAVILYVNATPVAPLAVVGLVITGGGGLMVNVRVLVPVPPALVALTVTDEVPAVVGVPEITPVPVLTLNPPGNPVAPKLVGLLLAVIV
jgi:hypothetical protein